MMNTFFFILPLLSLIGKLSMLCCSAEVLAAGDDVANFIAQNIHENHVMIFAKSYCPYCMRTKQTFESLTNKLGIDSILKYKVVELDELPENDGPKIQHHLYETTGQRTVPNVFIGGEHVGGDSDVQSLFEEKLLHQMVLEASAMSDL